MSSSASSKENSLSETKNVSSRNQSSASGKSNSANISEKEKKPAVSRLYQSTAASAAKASKQPSNGANQPPVKNRTPVLQRKTYGASSAKPTPGPQCPQNLKPPMASATKARSLSKGSPTAATPSPVTNGVATSSFINHEAKASPADWDASAISPFEGAIHPTEAIAGTNEVILKGYLDVGVTKTAKSEKPNSKKGPMLALPTLPIFNKSDPLKSNKSDLSDSISLETPKLPSQHFFNTPSSGFKSVSEDSVDEMMELYDDYLLSTLIRLKAEKSLVDVTSKIETVVSTLWLAVESLRSTVIEKADLNRRLTASLDLMHDLDKDLQIFHQLMSTDDAFSSTSKDLIKLSKSLEHCRHHLQVLKSNMAVDQSTVESLSSAIGKGLSFNCDTSTKTFLPEAEALKKLEENLSTVVNVFQQCQKSTNNVIGLLVERASLKISKEQIQDPTKTNILTLLE